MWFVRDDIPFVYVNYFAVGMEFQGKNNNSKDNNIKNIM